MKAMRSILISIALILVSSEAKATFSIVAVDRATGEVGSAGASCINGSIVISEVIPGRGAIHAQARLNVANKRNARMRMLAGDSPQQILDFLINNDVERIPQTRQYGIVDFSPARTPRSSAFTGASALDFKADITGPDYAIQGNILLNATVLRRIESGFLNTSGSLARRLMAALQGAKFAGADRRCGTRNTSSQSAFIRVARPNDSPTNLFIDINVNSTPAGVEPIDVLQGRFDQARPNF
jgi:uncharacterized Ntn-hydrolase superfamily protein